MSEKLDLIDRFLFTSLAITDEEFRDKILGLGANIHAVYDGKTSLIYAVERLAEAGKVHPYIKFLVERGVDINARGDCGFTALHLAVDSAEASLDLVKFLVDSGADIHARDENGRGLIHRAKSLELLKYIVGLGLDSSLPKKEMSVVLFENENFNKLDVVQFLLEQGFDLNAYHCTSLLHMAARNGNLEMVEFYLDKGLDPNRIDDYGDLPLTSVIGMVDHFGLEMLSGSTGDYKKVIMKLLDVTDLSLFRG